MVQLVPVRVGLVHNCAFQMNLGSGIETQVLSGLSENITIFIMIINIDLLCVSAVGVVGEAAVDRLLTQLPADRRLRRS